MVTVVRRAAFMCVPAMLLVALSTIVAGCAAASRGNMPGKPAAEAVPDYPRLRARIETLVAAMASGDDETAYGIHAPVLRAGLSLDEFKRGRDDPDGERIGPVQMTIHAVTPCFCGEVSYPPDLGPTGKVLRCVLLIDGSAITNGREERSQALMAWEHIEGEWYFLLVEEGDACPRPNA